MSADKSRAERLADAGFAPPGRHLHLLPETNIPALQPVSEPSDEDIERAYVETMGQHLRPQDRASVLNVCRAVLALRPKVQPLTDAYEAAQTAIVGRFTVHKRIGGGFWPYCVRAGTGTQEVFVGHRAQCEAVAQALQTACLDGAYMVAHGISQGGV